MRSLILFTILFFVGLQSHSQTTVSGTISHTSGTRSYQLYLPAIYDGNTPVPLVLNLHGYGSNNTQQMLYGDFKGIADTANFLILAPQGLNDGTGTAHWNASWGTGVDDLSFLSALIDSIASDYNINLNRVYSTGMSNGGFMSLTLAGQLSSKITAVASVTGTMSILQIPQNTVVGPMPVMQIHGTADPTVSYIGDQYFLGVDSVLNYWAAHNGCNPVPSVSAVPNINTTDGCTAELIEYTGAASGADVVHYKITNGGHTWPGASVTIGVTNQDFDASIEIWKFFSRYDKSNLTSTPSIKTVDWLEIQSPNPINDNILIQIEHTNEVLVEVYSLGGRLLHKQNGFSSIQINTKEWAYGVYVLRCQSEGVPTYTKKLVKE